MPSPELVGDELTIRDHWDRVHTRHWPTVVESIVRRVWPEMPMPEAVLEVKAHVHCHWRGLATYRKNRIRLTLGPPAKLDDLLVGTVHELAHLADHHRHGVKRKGNGHQVHHGPTFRTEFADAAWRLWRIDVYKYGRVSTQQEQMAELLRVAMINEEVANAY